MLNNSYRVLIHTLTKRLCQLTYPQFFHGNPFFNYLTAKIPHKSPNGPRNHPDSNRGPLRRRERRQGPRNFAPRGSGRGPRTNRR